jgi:hypothetical protein
MKKRRRAIGIIILALFVMIGMPSVLIWRQYRQERLNRNLIAAIKRVDAEAVDTLLQQGASANATDRGQSDGLRAMLKRLLARWRHQDDGSETTLNKPVLAILLEQAMQIWMATREPHYERFALYDTIAAKLVSHGADPNIPIPEFGSPLYCVTDWHMDQTVRALLSKGANANVIMSEERRDESGYVPLMVADEESAALLLRYGADPNRRDADGETPLIAVCQEVDDEKTDIGTVRLLIAAGVDVNTRDHSGKTALFNVRRNRISGPVERQQLVRLLKAAGAKE